MSMRGKVTGALAWVGLVIVIAVPAAELVSSRLIPMLTGASAAKVDSPAEAVATAPAETAKGEAATAEPTPAAVAPAAAAPKPEAVSAKPADKPHDSNDTALDEYLSSGRKLPDYLTAGKAKGAPGSAAPAAEAPAGPMNDTAATPPVAPADTAAASIEPSATNADRPQPDAAASLDNAAPASETPVVASAPPVVPVPLPAKARPKPVVAPTVTEDDFKGWKSGSLEDYLKQRGLLSGEPAANN